MARSRSTVLISEGYSAKNLGDAELVYASIDIAAESHPGSDLVLVALEPESFARLRSDCVALPRLFDRRLYSTASRAQRVLILARWLAFVALSTFSATVPYVRRPLDATANKILPSSSRETHLAYLDAKKQVAVGGGYLGDKYRKESLLTAWSWWWAVRRGVQFESMPMSVEARTASLRYFLRMTLPASGLRARDLSTKSVLKAVGRDVELLPDLAFRNIRQVPSTHSPTRNCYVFPVGSDYYAESVWRQQLGELRNALEVVGLFGVGMPMHSSVAGGFAGFDSVAVDFWASWA